MNFLTVEEFAERFKISPATVRKSIREGRIYATRLSAGKKAPYRICETEIERLHLQSMCEAKNRR